MTDWARNEDLGLTTTSVGIPTLDHNKKYKGLSPAAYKLLTTIQGRNLVCKPGCTWHIIDNTGQKLFIIDYFNIFFGLIVSMNLQNLRGDLLHKFTFQESRLILSHFQKVWKEHLVNEINRFNKSELNSLLERLK